jgi:L-fucose mutarotase/ribose pyranase (RbsD/FucU family)
MPRTNMKSALCTVDGKLQMDLLHAITGMQHGRGMIAKSDFERLTRSCTVDGKLQMDLLRAITRMQARRGMIAKSDFELLTTFCTVDGKLQMDLLRAITRMQHGRGMIAKSDFERLTRSCTVDGKLQIDLLRAITGRDVRKTQPNIHPNKTEFPFSMVVQPSLHAREWISENGKEPSKDFADFLGQVRDRHYPDSGLNSLEIDDLIEDDNDNNWIFPDYSEHGDNFLNLP